MRSDVTHAIRVHETGGPDVLRWEEVDIGQPGPGQIRLRHTAIGLNYVDVYHRTGLYPQPLPFVPGMEGAGVVEAVGARVTDLAPGDRVAHVGPIGGYAEVRLIPADRVVRLPDAVSDRDAAAMMLQGMTAYCLIHTVYPLQAGDTILVHAAAGGVGLILCQWAAALGATVIGTVSSDEKAALARANGCRYTIVHGREDVRVRVLEITGGDKLPVVYDSIGKDTFMASLDCVKPRGLMVTYGQSSGPIGPFDLALLAQKGSLFLTRPSVFSYIATRDELVAAATAVFDVVTAGTVRIAVNQTYALRDAAQAHRDLEARRTTGSTVLLA